MVRALKFLPVAVILASVSVACGTVEEKDEPAAGLSTPTPSEVAVEEPAATPEPPKPLPRCGPIWSEDVLPRGYEGCKDDGRRITRKLHCSTGQLLYIYQDRFFGIPGARIFQATGELEDDAQFRKMHRVCSA